MKKLTMILLALLMLLALGCSALAETTGVALPDGRALRLEAQLVGRQINGGACEEEEIYRLDVYEGQEDQPKQTLDFTRENGEMMIQAVDLDFDGYLDLDILYGAGATNSCHTFFRWDPAQDQFTHESGIYTWLSSYTLYPEKKLISNFLHNSAAEGVTQLFRWERDAEGQPRLTLIREAEVAADPEEPDTLNLIIREPSQEWGELMETARYSYSFDQAVENAAIYEKEEQLLWEGLE